MLTAYQEVFRRTSSLFLPADASAPTRPVWAMAKSAQDAAGLAKRHRSWLDAIGFKPRAGHWTALPGNDGIDGVAFGIGDGQTQSPLLAGALSCGLPGGDYHFASGLGDPQLAALSWALGAYTFKTYQSGESRSPVRLKAPAGADIEEASRIAAAVWFGRDLINTPPNDFGPAELEAAARDVAAAFGARIAVTVGDDLIEANFPLLHAVGRASSRPPRLIDLSWGDAGPKFTVIGKGICFDTGGLNLKPGPGMALMKKDMGGAASALALAIMIMGAKLPVRLRMLIPAAENSISGSAFRPSDIIKSRAGLTVEVGDTDAEGRLVLADAMALADEDAPDTLITFATLTGAARVALGPDLPPLYSTDDDFAAGLVAAGREVGDPMWPMPLWQPYDFLLDGKVGDVCSVHPEPFAGSVMAALFLRRFVKNAKRFAHLDMYGWVSRPQPGKTPGGEPQCARAVYNYLRTRLKADD